MSVEDRNYGTLIANNINLAITEHATRHFNDALAQLVKFSELGNNLVTYTISCKLYTDNIYVNTIQELAKKNNVKVRFSYQYSCKSKFGGPYYYDYTAYCEGLFGEILLKTWYVIYLHWKCEKNDSYEAWFELYI